MEVDVFGPQSEVGKRAEVAAVKVQPLGSKSANVQPAGIRFVMVGIALGAFAIKAHSACASIPTFRRRKLE
jgi:hypothetical protein